MIHTFALAIPDMPSGHFDAMIPDIFAVTKWFLKEYQAFVMIGTAVVLAFTILALIASLFDRRKDKDDDDEYDIY